jgi:hypothetical protein
MHIARQQIPNTHQWTNREVVFSKQSAPHDATILLDTVFPMWSMPWCYKQDKSRASLAGRQSPTSKDMNTEAEEATMLEAITRRQPVKIQQTKKT